MNIYEKLIEVRKRVPYLQKIAEGEQYKYVSSSQVLSKVREEMDKQGLLLIPKVMSKNVTGDMVEKKDKYGNTKHTTTYFTELNMSYVWINAEKPEEKIECPWYGQGVDIAGEKGVGKALTYAEKYFLLKFFNIATDKDDPDAFQNKLDSLDNPKGEQTTNNVTDKEVEDLFKLGESKSISSKSIKDTIMKNFKKTEVKALTRDEYERTYRGLEKYKPKEANA